MSAVPPVPVVAAHELTKTFRLDWRRGRLLALDRLDLHVHAGEIFGLLGPNGSGKSTTIKLILGLLRPTSGTIRVCGHEAWSMEARRQTGFLPENPYFPLFLRASEVLSYYGPLCGLRGESLRRRIKELLELVSLDKADDRPLKTFSKGMLQRIGLAQALLHDPQILLLDEPTAGVDPVGSRMIRDLMLELKRRGKTVIFTSHLLEQVEEVSDRVAIVHQGRKLCEGNLRELLRVEDGLVVDLPGVTPDRMAEVERVLAENGFAGVRVRHPERRLEDLFLERIGRP
jgi:ABC-2 type transport system ATP-binding protein